MKTLSMRWTGIRPMLMHNGELADPLNPIVEQMKEITSKGTKKITRDDLLVLSRLEWEGGLYWDDEIGPYIPNDNIERVIQVGAQRNRKGKDIMAAVFVADEIVKLEYKGSRDKEKLYNNPDYQLRKGVKINNKVRVIRVRPRFPEWSIQFTLEYDESVISKEHIIKACENAGLYVGLGDWHPKYGRFEAEVLK